MNVQFHATIDHSTSGPKSTRLHKDDSALDKTRHLAGQTIARHEALPNTRGRFIPSAFRAMTHFNLLISLMRVGPLGDAEHEEKGVWLDLVTFCCEQENGGTIRNADKWTAKQWAKIGLTFERIKTGSPLWKLAQNGTLTVTNYPSSHEVRAKAQREAARRTNDYRWKNRPFYRPLKKSVSESVSESVSDGEEKVREKKAKESEALNGQIAHENE